VAIGVDDQPQTSDAKRRRWTARRVAGAVLIALPTIHEGRSSTAGVLMILVALLSYAFALNIAEPLQHKYGALPVIWRAQACGDDSDRATWRSRLFRAQWTRGPFLAILVLARSEQASHSCSWPPPSVASDRRAPQPPCF
jgi:hypothetical protein